MTAEIRTFEQSVIDVAIRVTGGFSDRLHNTGLSVKTDIRKEFKDGLLSAELRLSFYRDNDLVDALEAFIVKDGAPVVALADLESWLRDGIEDVLSAPVIDG
jgi:hypothetical protein